MYRPAMVLIAGLAVILACENAPDPTGPELPDPQFHLVDGDPAADWNDAYSMYYFDLNLKNDILVKLAQTHSEGIELAECENNPDSHHDLQAFPNPLSEADRHSAVGFGWFADRRSWPWKRGSLVVQAACWFDEWNEGGFPESAVVWGQARIGWWQSAPFRVILKSSGFPAEGHPLPLDIAWLQVQGITDLLVIGELHHEDDTTLIQ